VPGTRCHHPLDRPAAPWRVLGLALLVLAATGGAPPAAADPDPLTEPEEQGIYDPWEGYNRAIFEFNDALQRYFAEPVARAWRFTVPDFARRGLRNFFVNCAFPIRVVNTTLQAKPLATGQEILRFVFNAGFGVGGFFDPATHAIYLPIHKEDFGQTLGYWGVPAGPYFMIPIFGPSTVRDTVGLVADVTTGAATFNLIGVSVPFFATFAAQAGNYINSQSYIADDIDRERELSVDFYASVRNSYLQFRENRIADREYDEEPAELEDDLYYLDEEEDLYYPEDEEPTGDAGAGAD
jgi:phospholipid-binding lipoprotein MlaA